MNPKLKDLSNAIRFLSIDAVQKANSGHPGMPMGMSDVATVLFKYYLRFNPKNPDWLNRDRFILSAGHGSMLLYSLLYLTGYKSVSLDDIKNFRTGDNQKVSSKTGITRVAKGLTRTPSTKTRTIRRGGFGAAARSIGTRFSSAGKFRRFGGFRSFGG